MVFIFKETSAGHGGAYLKAFSEAVDGAAILQKSDAVSSDCRSDFPSPFYGGGLFTSNNRIAFLRTSRRPSPPPTALTYALTAQAHIPEIKGDEKTKEAMFLKKEASRHVMKKATPITPQEMKKIAQLPPSRTKHTVMLMWITAERHADLRAGRLVRSFEGIRFGPWKSDPLGAQASKTVPVSTEILQLLQHEEYVKFSSFPRNRCKWHQSFGTRSPKGKRRD